MTHANQERVILPDETGDILHALISTLDIGALTKLAKGLTAFVKSVAECNHDNRPSLNGADDFEPIVLPDRKPFRLTPDQRAEIVERRARGETQTAIALAVGCSAGTVNKLLGAKRQAEKEGGAK